MQTESPYYQPESGITAFAYQPGVGHFTDDPTFAESSAANCYSAWAFRLSNSSQIFIYSSGFYSFFDKHNLGCGSQQNCQEHLIETNDVGDLFYYNIFTYGSAEIVSPAGGIIPPIFFNDSNQNGYTSEVAAFLELSVNSDVNLGIGSNASDGSGIVYIDPTIWSEPQVSRSVDCLPPCTIVLPPILLSTPTVISFPPWTTTLLIGWTTTVSHSTSGAVITSSYSTSITQTTVLSIPHVTTTKISIWNVLIPPSVTSTAIYPTSSVMPGPIVVIDNPNPLSQSGVSHTASSRTIYPPPWPWITMTSSHDPQLPSMTFGSGLPMPTCYSGCGTICQYACHPCNPVAGSCGLTNNCCIPGQFCTTGCPPGIEPQSQGTSGLTTYTTFPPDMTWFTTSAATNTHDGGGHPIFGKWPGCWFCPSGSDGFDFPNWPPGIYPPGGPSPGLPTPFPAVTIFPDGTPEYPEDHSDSQSETLTCTKTTEYPSCQETILIIESINSDFSGTSATSFETMTTAVCEMVTACSGAGTTQITTESSTTSAEQFCEPSNCGAACANERVLPTSVSKSQSRSRARKASINVPLTAKRPESFNIEHDPLNSTNAYLRKRNFPAPGSGTWEDFYTNLENSPNTATLDDEVGLYGTDSAFEIYAFGSNPSNSMVVGLWGCLSVIVVSHQGALLTHFWENPTLIHNMQAGVLDPLDDILTEEASIYFSSTQTQIFIMVGALDFTYTAGPKDILSFSESSSSRPLRSEQVGQIETKLNEFFPNIKPIVFVYVRQKDVEIRSEGAWGRAVVIFEPDQTVDPNTGDQFPDNTAGLQVYLQAYKAFEQTWPYVELQIWRVNVPESGREPAGSANVVKQLNVGGTVNPCDGGLDPPPPVADSESVTKGSTDINVNDPSQAFDVTDAAGNKVQTGCLFTGSGTYAPTAQSGSGFIAGTLTCSGGYSVNCYRPGDNSAATTCGNGDVSECETLGENCDTYYQPLATCNY